MKRHLLSISLILLTITACASPTPLPTSKPPEQSTETAPALGNIYYISSSNGNDDWLGVSPDQPWRTLAKISSITFQPHDQILLKRGDVWDGEELVLHGSGDFMDDSWITLGAYGEGSKPRITNPPFDESIDISESWSAVNAVYPDQYRQFMTIAVRMDGNGWFISGLEIDHAEVGVYVPSGGARYWIEDMYFHDILGLFMPMAPDWEATQGQSMWEPFPSPSWGNAIQFDSADYVYVRDIVIERATGGIGGFANVGVVENVFIDKATTGGLNFNGSNVTIRYATVLNGQWPGGAWYGADPFISSWDSGWVVERSEVAYTTNYDHIPGVNPGVQDASPVDFDLEAVNSAVRDNFFHDNIGSCFEFNLGGTGNRNIVIENNVCYNNGLEDDPRPDGDYARVAFAADACGFYSNTSFIIQDNVIYKAFPGQYLNFHFERENPQVNDFSYGEQKCGHVASNNAVYEYGEYSLPLPIPEPPTIEQENIAPSARVSVSSGEDSAYFAQDGALDTEWVSAEAQPWIRYEWDSLQTIDTIRLFDRPDLDNWAVSGLLTFSDGSSINVTGGILNNGAMREALFDEPKTVTWVQFTVTRNAPENPGTNVGLTELQVYLAAAPPPPAPAPDPGTFTVDFEDRPETPAPMMNQYPDNANGIDWANGDFWTTAADPASGNRYLFLDFPRDWSNKPVSRGAMFILPRGKILQSVSVACPAGATVALYQSGQSYVTANCVGDYESLATGWGAPLSSNIVSVWIDLSATSANLNDVWFDNLVYGD